MQVLCEGFEEDTGLYYGRTYADSVEVDGKVCVRFEGAVSAGDFVQVRIDDSLGADLSGTRLGG